MTQQEFTQRTNVTVSIEEFEAINTVYMNSEVDKDEFCKMWCKMNAKRVAKAVATKKAAEEEDDLKWELLYIKTREYSSEEYLKFAVDVLSKKDLKFIAKAGIETEKEVYNVYFNTNHRVPKTLSTVLYDIFTWFEQHITVA